MPIHVFVKFQVCHVDFNCHSVSNLLAYASAGPNSRRAIPKVKYPYYIRQAPVT